MNILIAPDSFKDCLDAVQVAHYIGKGIKKAEENVIIKELPLADGGEGFVQTMLSALGGKMINLNALDPLGRETTAFYGILSDKNTAVIEMAAASGIEKLLPEERNPLTASTYGTGQLILNALNNGCKKIIIGIGGSATNDGGTGMAKALGYRFLNKNGEEIPEGGGALNQLEEIDQSGKTTLLSNIEINVACDVTNPLCGANGASAIYGPQKGAKPSTVEQLDKNLLHLSEIIKKDLKLNVLDLPGGGAAGGLGAGLVAFAGGTLKKGFDIVEEQSQLEKHVAWADIVYTGEGKMDAQTAQGKTPWGVAQLAKKHNKPLIAIAGTLGEGYRELYLEGFTSVFALPNGPADLQSCLNNAPDLLTEMGEKTMRLFLAK